MKGHEKSHLGFSPGQQTGPQVSGDNCVSSNVSTNKCVEFQQILSQDSGFFGCYPGVARSACSSTFLRSSQVFRVCGPACEAWWPGALCSSSSLLVQMLCSVLRLVSPSERHIWLCTHPLRSTWVFVPGSARMPEILLQGEGARVGELYPRSRPALPALR